MYTLGERFPCRMLITYGQQRKCFLYQSTPLRQCNRIFRIPCHCIYGNDFKEDIYGDDERIREYVIEAVEDLIIDEGALELAFEGSRFSDLARVAIRRNDPTFLAKRVAKRGGDMDMGLYNFLSRSSKNWYLPFPTE